MVAIDPSSARRRSRISLRFLTSRLVVILGAVAGGILLVHLREQLLFFGGHEAIIVEAPAYYNPGIRSRLFDKECRYYLAESAIPNGGLGIFSAISIAHGKISVGVSHRPENLFYSPSLPLAHTHDSLTMDDDHHHYYYNNDHSRYNRKAA
jgi:hypothetical protein